MALAYVLVTGFVFLFTGGSVDYPCGRVYEDQGDCMFPRREEDSRTSPRIDLYQSVYWANWSGGGCDRLRTDDDALRIGAWRRVERDGSGVRVNDTVLEKGQSLEIHPFDPNPWTTSYFKVTNRGVVPVCDLQQPAQDRYATFPGSERLLITGDRGTEFAPVKGLSALLLVFGGFVALARWSRPA